MDITEATRMVLGISGKKDCNNCRFFGEEYLRNRNYGSSWCHHPDWLGSNTPQGAEDLPCSRRGPTPMILWEPKIDE